MPELEIWGRIKTTTLLRLARHLEDLLENWKDLLSLESERKLQVITGRKKNCNSNNLYLKDHTTKWFFFKGSNSLTLQGNFLS